MQLHFFCVCPENGHIHGLYQLTRKLYREFVPWKGWIPAQFAPAACATMWHIISHTLGVSANLRQALKNPCGLYENAADLVLFTVRLSNSIFFTLNSGH